MTTSLVRNTPLQLLPMRVEAFRHRIAARVWRTVAEVDAEGSQTLAAPVDLARACRLALRPRTCTSSAAASTPSGTGARHGQGSTCAIPGALAAAADAWDAAGGGDTGLAALARPLEAALHQARASSWQPRMALVGHSHIDAPFMWLVAEAERKAVHTAATAVRLCERDPNFRYTMSQPMLWEAMGAGWCEADTQIPCGEALARNLILGREYFAQLNGGRRGRVLWLPDCFGFSACLPSVMRQVGLDGFFSVKMFWSQLTAFPHHSWVWRCPDGAEVVGHTFGTGDYSLDLDLAEARLHAQEYAQGDVAPELVAPIGHGDGLIIRLHETAGCAGTARITGVGRRCRLVDLSGNPLAVLKPRAGSCAIPHSPHAICGLELR